ncbi:MAG TPA: hypothetical protein VKP08_13155, partial [Anaerolineales bacterium]|nr:hypothetical protein [Anaerolineales bacterium]
MKKQTLYIIFGVAIITLAACSVDYGTPAAPTQKPARSAMSDVEIFSTGTALAWAATSTAAVVPSTPTAMQISGMPISFEHVSFVIPDGLASGADLELVQGLGEEYEPWERYPTHPEFQLTGYLIVYGKYTHPEIIVYPAEEYAQINPNGAEQIDRIKKILAGTTPTKETLPMMPFAGTRATINAKIEIVPFQNGRGVRTLMQYGSYAGQINNEDLFYHFQGLTDDGKYHVVVNLPITAPILPATH